MNYLRRFFRTWLPLGSFDPSARLFLLAVIIDGVIFSAWSLFFNLFILARGFDKEFLGMLNSASSVGALLLGIPLGMLSDRLGRRRSMLIGLVISFLGMGMQLFSDVGAWLLLVAFIGGLGNMLYSVSQAPFMMKVSNRENRMLLFSLNSGLITLAGAVGSLFAGQMPDLFARAFQFGSGSMEAYRAVLLVSVVLGSFSLIPIFLLKEPKSVEEVKPEEKREPVLHAIFRPLVFRMMLPQLLIGLGAAILVPYMNLFFVERYGFQSGLLGAVFSLSALITGLSSMVGPRLAFKFGSKIKTVVVTQSSSLVFLLLLGFAPFGWLAVVGFLMRAALMNMASPLYSAFVMEQVPEHQQGTVNSVMNTVWVLGWAIGPFVSGLVQQRYGFTPLFIATATFYGLAVFFTWLFFHKHETPVSTRILQPEVVAE